MDPEDHKLKKQKVAEKKAPLFTVVYEDGSLSVKSRAEALNYCQNKFPNGTTKVTALCILRFQI